MSARKSSCFAQYFHRRNSDGSFDSICGLCFLTVANGASREKLVTEEATHLCRTFSHAKMSAFTKH
jgi:hypothetical protein